MSTVKSRIVSFACEIYRYLFTKGRVRELIIFDLSNFQYSDPEKREELQHDMENAIANLEAWKSHILRAVHQDAAKKCCY